MGSSQEVGNNYPSPDPVMIQLKQSENQLRGTERELGTARCKIKAMKQMESLKDRALMELSEELKRVDDKLTTAENYLESKNLELKKVSSEKKEALAGQFAAEATLKRVHATQEDEEFFPIESVIGPFESEIKEYKKEISRQHKDKKALQGMIKSKETALVEMEKILHSALERVLIVEDVQNQNLELKRQLKICQDENKHLNKIHCQKGVEVEKLTRSIHELKESILGYDATANAARDYQRQITELNEEKRTLEMELARARVSVNRVAAVVANQWKDENNRVFPVNQWLEERKCLQEEIHCLQGKMAISERTAKAEAQLKERLRLRLHILEEGLKHVSGLPVKHAKSSEQGSEVLSQSQEPRNKSTFQARTAHPANMAFILQNNQSKSVKILARNNLSSPRDYKEKMNAKVQIESREVVDNVTPREIQVSEIDTSICNDVESQMKGGQGYDFDDTVSGFLYDKLQKQVINLRQSLEQKDGQLKAKDGESKKLLKKVDTLTKAMEQQAKTMRREAMARKKAAKHHTSSQCGGDIKLLSQFLEFYHNVREATHH